MRLIRKRMREVAASASPWTWVGLYVAATYASLPFGRVIVDTLRSQSLLAVTVVTLASLSIGGIGYLCWRQRIWEKPRRVALLAGGIVALCLYADSLPLWEERIHLVQYAILGMLVGWAFPAQASFPSPAVAGITCIFGYGDEAIQYFLPSRYFDWRDVAFNAVAGTFGAAAYLMIAKREADQMPASDVPHYPGDSSLP